MAIRIMLDRDNNMRGHFSRAAIVSARLACLAFALWACAPSVALSQTPSPLQEWQYSSGFVLEKLFKPDLPEWRVVLGAGAALKPLYDGAQLMRVPAASRKLEKADHVRRSVDYVC